MCITQGRGFVCAESCNEDEDCQPADADGTVFCYANTVCAIVCEGDSDCLPGMSCNFSICYWE